MTQIERADAILEFLQNIDDKDDALEFVRIALDALENGTLSYDKDFDRQAVIEIIKEVEYRNIDWR